MQYCLHDTLKEDSGAKKFVFSDNSGPLRDNFVYVSIKSIWFHMIHGGEARDLKLEIPG